MLGEAFYEHFKVAHEVKCTDIDVNEPWLSYLDFRQAAAYRADVVAFQPDWLFHIGAHTGLEYCELHTEDAYETNTKAVEHAVAIANELRIPLLYISTAGIFNGQKPVYDEADEPDPIGHYGKSKFLGERYVQNNAGEYLICRAGWMMGGGVRKDKKFIEKLMKQMREGHTVLRVVNDKLGTPTYTHDFARNTALLVDKGERGLFNMVCKGLTGRFEVAQELVSLLPVGNRVRIEEVPSDYFAEEYFAERPDCERLINKRLDDLGLNIMRDWRVALRDYVAEYYRSETFDRPMRG